MLNGLTSNNIVNSIFPQYSRYAVLDLTEYNKKLCVNVPNPLTIQSNLENPDTTFVITGNLVNRLDLVSLKFYSTPRYWWVLAYYNKIKNPYSLPHGTILKVPSYTTLLLNDIAKS